MSEEKIDVKIGTKAESEWTNLLEMQKEVILKSEMNIEIGNLLTDLAKRKIAEEQGK